MVKSIKMMEEIIKLNKKYEDLNYRMTVIEAFRSSSGATETAKLIINTGDDKGKDEIKIKLQLTDTLIDDIWDQLNTELIATLNKLNTAMNCLFLELRDSDITKSQANERTGQMPIVIPKSRRIRGGESNEF